MKPKTVAEARKLLADLRAARESRHVQQVAALLKQVAR